VSDEHGAGANVDGVVWRREDGSKRASGEMGREEKGRGTHVLPIPRVSRW